jgi:hypothetical protein
MPLIRTPALWLIDLTGHFPQAIQPGLFAAVVLFIGWLLVRKHRLIWNGAVRCTSVAIDLAIRIILLPEYAWTRSRRVQGHLPGALAVTSGQLAERVLDRAALAYERHGPVKSAGRRPPIVWAAIFCLVSLLVHWLMLRMPPTGTTQFAAKAWGYWLTFDTWAHGA